MSQGREYNIREAIGSDLPFIYDTFLKSYYKDSLIARICRTSIFFNHYRIILDQILEDSKVRVACHQDDPTVIFGYIISDKDILHYLFIKEAFRELGIAKDLYQEALKDAQSTFSYVTHQTGMSKRLNIETPYNPFILYSAIQTKTKEK